MKLKLKKENEFKYTGPTSLKKIEARLLEIEKEVPVRRDNAQENYSESVEDEKEASEITYLEVEKAQLIQKRQFILDQRSSWKAKGIWNIVVPVIVAIITTYMVSALVK